MSSDEIYLALLEIFILVTAAQSIKIVMGKARIPSLFGELLTGLILGPYALGTIINSITGLQIFTFNNYLTLFSEFAVILLIFAAGLEHGFKSLRSSGVSAFLSASMGAALPFLGVYLYSSRYFPFNTALLMGAASAATSLAAVASLIEGGKLETERYIKILLSAAAIDDVVAFIILSVSLSLISDNQLSALAVFRTSLLVLLSWLIILFFSVLIIPRIISLVSDSLVIDVSLLVLFVLVTVMISLGFSPVIAAFIAGVSISESRKAERIRGMVRTLLGVFGSIFFITIGAETDVFTFVSPVVLLQGIIITLIAITMKFLGVIPFNYLYTKDVRRSIAASLGMIPRGEMGLVISSIAFSSGIFSQTELSEVVLMSLLTTVVGGTLFDRMNKKILISKN
jgi:Kef-type K+ transport systems, membrane components